MIPFRPQNEVLLIRSAKKFKACCFFQKSGVALQKIDAVEQKGVRIGVSLAPFFAKSN